MARTRAPDRIRVRRQPARALYEREALDAALDRGLFAHVAFVDGESPVCIPMLHARVKDTVYVHGSTASRAMRILGRGAPACLTVTTLHGLVLARSVFEHSANYGSAIVFGSFAAVEGTEERLAALRAFTERLLPGRWAEARQPSPKELKATSIVALDLGGAEWSVKARSGPPEDDDTEDAELDVWAGVLPLRSSYGSPQASPGLKPGIPVPESVERLRSAGL